MLINTLKEEIKQSMKDGTRLKTDILKLVVSDCDRINANKGTVTDDDVINVIEKIIKSNNECLSVRDNQDLVYENNVLKTFLPSKASMEDILALVKEEDIRNCKNDGMAMGLVFKTLKSNGIYFDNGDVKNLVASVRAK